MTWSQRNAEVDADLHERAMDEAPVGITISDATREDNPLIYANEAFERITGYPREEMIGRNCRILQGEESDREAIATMREAVNDGEAVSVELVNYRRDGESFWNEVTIAPLRDETGRITNFVGFQNDVTDRKEAELELQRERRNLNRLLTRIRGLVGDVTRDLVEAESREAVERRVVNRFTETEMYSFAWIGRTDRSDRQITPRAWAGAFDGADPEQTVDLDDNHPITRAIRTHRVDSTDGEDGDAAQAEDDANWIPITRGGDDGAVIVPLSDGRTCYGVLVLGAVRLADVDRREIAVLESLGRAIAVALNALKSRRILSTDSFIEIELAVTDRSLFFVDLSDRCDCRFEYRGSVRNEDGKLSMFFMTDRSPERINCQLSSTDVDHVHSVGSGEEWGLFEFSVGADSLVADLAGRGVRTRSISAENGRARIRLELPPEVDSRSITDHFRDRYPSTELVGYHERERPPLTREEFVERVKDRLTDRQFTALQRAYLGGYYDQPRTTSGDELADSMGVSRATFHQHLRAAERKLLSEFLDH